MKAYKTAFQFANLPQITNLTLSELITTCTWMCISFIKYFAFSYSFPSCENSNINTNINMNLHELGMLHQAEHSARTHTKKGK